MKKILKFLILNFFKFVFIRLLRSFEKFWDLINLFFKDIFEEILYLLKFSSLESFEKSSYSKEVSR